MSITAMSVWHGAVPPMYIDEARMLARHLDAAEVSGADSWPKDLAIVAPTMNLFADEDNAIWLHALDHWKAEHWNEAVAYLDKHPVNYHVIITLSASPVKSIASRATAVYDWQEPTKVADTATQIRQWLAKRGRDIDLPAAKKIAQSCAAEKNAAQRVAVAASALPQGRLTWDDLAPLVDSALMSKAPIWAIGDAIATGRADNVIRAVQAAHDTDAYATLRYLEKRYRIMAMQTSGLSRDRIMQAMPDVKPFILAKTAEVSRSLNSAACALAMRVIDNAFEHLLSTQRHLHRTIIEQAALNLAKLHPHH